MQIVLDFSSDDMLLSKQAKLTDMEAICNQTGKTFTITEAEKAFLESKGIPLPNLSPIARLRRLFAFRNEWILFERKCDKTGNSMISSYRPDAPFPVYDKDIWLAADSFDARDYGQPYDFNRPFFEQWHELNLRVPHMSRTAANTENSPYVHLAIGLQNCYLTFSCLESQDCMYGVRVYQCRDCIDNTYITHCELCYECVNCHNCYDLKWSIHCFNSRESAFLYNCRNCSNCFGCVGLDHKQYCIWNVQYSKEEYEARMKELTTNSRTNLALIQKRWRDFLQEKNATYQSLVNSENCDGQYIDGSLDCHQSYFLRNCQNVDGSFNLESCKDCFSSVTSTGGQLHYMNMGVRRNSYNVQLCFTAMQLSDSQYTSGVIPEGNNLFGCSHFNQKASYCILNKQYTKQEYEELLPRVIAHMKATGEYGQFFPLKYSDYPYSDSIAQEFFPITTAAEAQNLGIPWTNQKAYPTLETWVPIPDTIDDVEESFCDKVIADKETQRAFRFQRKELAFYKAHHIPLPEYCFESRNLQRSQSLLRF